MDRIAVVDPVTTERVRGRALSALEERELFMVTRRRAGLSQGEVAERAGVSQVTLCKFERGMVYPSESLVERYWIALDGLMTEREDEAVA